MTFGFLSPQLISIFFLFVKVLFSFLKKRETKNQGDENPENAPFQKPKKSSRFSLDSPFISFSCLLRINLTKEHVHAPLIGFAPFPRTGPDKLLFSFLRWHNSTCNRTCNYLQWILNYKKNRNRYQAYPH